MTSKITIPSFGRVGWLCARFGFTDNGLHSFEYMLIPVVILGITYLLALHFLLRTLLFCDI
jgi:hypothetical protein